MTDKYAEDKLGEMIYFFGERPFEFIKDDVWNEYINRNKPFTKEQIEIFKEFLKYLIEDIN